MFEVREKPKMVERAYLVGVRTSEESEEHANLLLDELEELVETLAIGIVGREIVRIREPQARFLMGSGKAEEVLAAAREIEADCLVFDAELSPAQQRNWEALTKLCVIDRQEVILDIFAERAQTKEAVLQVDLARAEHSLPRLKNAWTHLSRQRGGGTTQRGEGEAQIELDARMVRQQIARLKRELEVVVKQRHVQRKQRQRVPLPTAAIVGYTNAGKSTLLNQITGASVLSEDKLFATLDPTTRQLQLPTGQKILVTDTVGFVRKLPHRLVEAFKATLEEAIVSDFLIHVLDVTSPEVDAHRETTLEVLKELGADDKRIITVYNKVDRLPPDAIRQPGTNGSIEGGQLNGLGDAGALKREKNAVYVSAFTGQGMERLYAEMERMLEKDTRVMQLLVPHDRYDVVNRLHQAGAVKQVDPKDDGVHILGNIPPRLYGLVEPFQV
ncbi:MAG: GTP-binding protein HflX [Puniceicoccaceae bacterium 5H]|nr:MAG: GTP-binding protein HflX [Puniceicoccaceae bacterium 5H]